MKTVRKINTFITKATLAGKSFTSSRQGNAYAQFVLDESLADKEREQLGYATHVIAKAKQAGETPSEIWSLIQTGFGAHNGQPMELTDMDDIKLGVLAFGAGICSQDRQVAGSITEYIDRVLDGRIFKADRVIG